MAPGVTVVILSKYWIQPVFRCLTIFNYPLFELPRSKLAFRDVSMRFVHGDFVVLHYLIGCCRAFNSIPLRYTGEKYHIIFLPRYAR